MEKFDFKSIEKKWKERWYKDNIYKAVDFSNKKKKYILAEFPYPSGKSMHIGHLMRYTVPEIYSRFFRMQGYNVLFPMGWDAFGLPAENFAIKTGTHPSIKIAEVTEAYRQSMQDIGYGIDWDREINTTDPKYYKWTQWIFLKFFEDGLAELRESPVWWSENLKTVLAEEEVIKDKEGNPVAERDGSPVERRSLKQWILKITKYADKLIDGLGQTKFPESIKSAQTKWIGRKEGVNITYAIKNEKQAVTVFTTRLETNFGATFIVTAPDSDFAKENTKRFPNSKEVKIYIEQSLQKTELERISEGRKKTGVFTGWYAINKLNGREMPIYIADFVLSTVGTGSVIGVPGHDMRDFEFAKANDLEIIRVVVGRDGDQSSIIRKEQVQTGSGTIINSDFINDLDIVEARKKITDYIIKKGWGNRIVNYKLRDWVFSRQRYWGEPIPLIHKQDGTIEAVVDTKLKDKVNEKLPLELPDVPNYLPIGDGTSPLARNERWVNTTAKDSTPAKRETNTMPNWAGSCWYYLRYLDPKNDQAFADYKKMKYWLPVDHYFGGGEHTTGHLLYSRFWHIFLYNQDLVPVPEPFMKRITGGILLAEDGTKMSKSKGNVVEPKDKIEQYGADAVRLYAAFLGPYEGTFPYSEASLGACNRLVSTIYGLKDKVSEEESSLEQKKKLHRLIKKITELSENLKMNVVVSEIMIFTKYLRESDSIPLDVWKSFIKLIAPFAVFIAEELWQEANKFKEWDKKHSVHLQSWPEYEEELTKIGNIQAAVQVDGKVRGTVLLSADDSKLNAIRKAESLQNVKKYIKGKEIKNIVYIPGKIINFVVK